MRDLTRDKADVTGSFARLADEAIKALRENERNKAKDICGVKFLRSKINAVRNKPIDFKGELWARNANSDVKGIDPLVDVALRMCSQHLQWDQDSGLMVVPIKHGDNTNVRFENLYRQLKSVILFGDEVLPKSELSAGDRPDPASIDRLRFVRNLGRALEMRVVLAGTGATAANMISETPPRYVERTGASRMGRSDLRWIECQFLWKTMSDIDVKGVVLPNLASPNGMQQALISALARGRPYLVHLFGRVMKRQKVDGPHMNSDTMRAVLEKVGDELQNAKDMSDESKLVYLTGVWLDQVYTSPVAFRLKPADLVRGDFFEPGVVVDLEGYPACVLLIGKRAHTSGHLRVKIYHYFYSDDGRIMWCASMKETNSEPREAFCWDFSGIQYPLLRACVQQCLAREPLLAVALSTQCYMNKRRFRNALSMLYQEPSQEQTVDAADGELNEHILFALLQLASNCEKLSGARVELGTFLQKIADYLTNDSDYAFAECVTNFRRQLDNYRKPGPSQVIRDAKSNLNIVDQTNNHDKYTLPWLVPACSSEALKQTVARASPLFDGIDIAGLVPGGRNTAFDAEAYSWSKLAGEPAWEFKDVPQPEWVFEFQPRSSLDYKTGEALRDLKSKCVEQQERLECHRATEQRDVLQCVEQQERLECHRATEQRDVLQCHAILIATTGGREVSCEIVYSEGGTGKYLRVALVIGLGRK